MEHNSSLEEKVLATAHSSKIQSATAGKSGGRSLSRWLHLEMYSELETLISEHNPCAQLTSFLLHNTGFQLQDGAIHNELVSPSPRR